MEEKIYEADCSKCGEHTTYPRDQVPVLCTCCENEAEQAAEDKRVNDNVLA